MNEETLIRTPPHSADAERAVLGGLMLDENAWDVAADIVGDDDFFLLKHRLIFGAIRELARRGSPFDAVTLVDHLAAKDEIEDVGGSAYLIGLANNTPSAANIDAYARIVRDKALLRRLAQIGSKIASDAFQSDGRTADELVSEAQRAVFDAGVRSSDTGLVEAKEACRAWFTSFQETYESGGGTTGLETPWPEITALSNGLQPGDLIILAGRPSMGKTIMGMQMAVHTALAGDYVAVFELEMSSRQLIGRAVSAVGRIPYAALKRADLDEDQYPTITGVMKRLAQSPLQIEDTPGLTVDQIVSRCRRAHSKKPLKFVVIDYLQIMEHCRERGRTDAASIGDTTRALKGLAKQLGVPLLVLSQLNRGLEARANKRPTMADLRDSGSIEQDADLILMVYRDDYYHSDTHLRGVVEVIVAKNRDGEAGGTVYLENRFAQMRMDSWVGPLPQASVVTEIPRRGISTRRSAGADRGHG